MNYTELSMNFGLIWSSLALGFLWLAWRDAVNRNIGRHRLLMIIMVVGSWLFVVSYLLRYIIPGESPELPSTAMLIWLIIHGSIALIPFIGGTLMVWARLHKGSSLLAMHINQNHPRYGSIVVPAWFFTHIGGITNYWLLS